MAIYSNIDGTSKKSFKVGLKGVSLTTEEITYISEGAEETIKELLVDGRAVLTEGNLRIPRDIVKSVTPIGDGTKFTIFHYDEDQRTYSLEEIVINTTSGGGNVSGPSSSVADNLVSFLDTTGQKLKDSGYSVGTSINDSTTQIPTVAAVKAYVEGKEIPLNQRMLGLTAENLTK